MLNFFGFRTFYKQFTVTQVTTVLTFFQIVKRVFVKSNGINVFKNTVDHTNILNTLNT